MEFLKQLETVLGQNKDYLDVDGKIIKGKVQEDALRQNPELIKLLLNNADTKKAFFTKVEDVLIFDKVQFSWVLSNKSFLPDSYTKFSNKIGLIDSEGSFITNKNEIVLSFPYKDCYLEGGQTKDDEKRKEIFLNQILNKNDIDFLLQPKVLTSYREFRLDDSTDEIKNYIIKGNNLIVLHSLLQKYRGKVKLIFIDPPYNTDNDTFGYNDSFNRSTWLVFMKNRLEVAKELISEDGSIYITIDYNEVHYLKVLMDEVFGQENFQREIIWRMGFLSGYKTMVKNFIRNHDTILFYSKNKDTMFFNKLYIDNKDFAPLLKPTKQMASYFKSLGLDDSKIEQIFRFINHESRGARYPLEDTWNCNKWDELSSIAIESATSRVEETVELDDRNFKGQKPEKLLKRIIQSSSDPGDLVMDFFLGTGTTLAVAHKLGRNYIGVEQMDYIDETVVPRMEKIVNGGDDYGISLDDDVNWEKGGSFAFFELKKLNQVLVDKILSATNENINLIFDKVINSPFITYKVFVKDVIENKNSFSELNLSEKREFLMEILDKNMLYVNLSDIDDELMDVTEDEKTFTKKFYGVK